MKINLTEADKERLVRLRRSFHQAPELGFEEIITSNRVERELQALGLTSERWCKTGIITVLEGEKSGPTVLLRADMDALPIQEENTHDYRSRHPGIMHACGHDAHTAILLGVAQVLSRDYIPLPGRIVLLFQPAEEGAPPGEEGGAELMVKEGVLKNPDVDAIFGLHISSQQPVGLITYKPGGIMAASQSFEITVKGKQTHGSQPWGGVDPIMAAVKIIDGLQTIISRESPLTQEAAVLSIGKITGGVRSNIIPEEVQIVGTLRTLDKNMQAYINKRMEEMVPAIAAAYRAEASIQIARGYPITYNDPALTAQMLPSLQAAAGASKVVETKAVTGAEDFSFFAQEVPGLYFFLGGRAPGGAEAFPHHTPDFKIDESGMLLGVKAFIQLSMDYLNN